MKGNAWWLVMGLELTPCWAEPCASVMGANCCFDDSFAVHLFGLGGTDPTAM